MQRRMGAHQQVPTRPFDFNPQAIPNGGRMATVRLKLMDDLTALPPRCPDGPGPAIGGTQEQATIGRLATPAGVEDRPVEDDEIPAALTPRAGRNHRCLSLAGVAVAVADRVGHRIPRSADLIQPRGAPGRPSPT